MSFAAPNRRQLFRTVRNSLGMLLASSQLFSQHNENPIDQSKPSKPPSLGTTVPDEIENLLALASTQHQAVYCDFVLSLLEHGTSQFAADFQQNLLEDVLVNANRASEPAPFRPIPSSIADTIPNLHNTALLATRCDALSLQCRAIRLLAQLDMHEAIRHFQLLTLPATDQENDREECAPSIYDYSEYYNLAANLLLHLRKAITSSAHEQEGTAIVSKVVSSSLTTNRLESLVVALRSLEDDAFVVGHVANTLPAALGSVAVGHYDFGIVGLTERSLGALFQLSLASMKFGFSVLPLLAAYKSLLIKSLGTDKCAADGLDLMSTFQEKVTHFNSLFAGPNSRLKVAIDPIPEVSQSQVAKLRFLPYQPVPWLWEGADRDSILAKLRRLRFFDSMEPLSQADRESSDEWNRLFRATLSDVVTLEGEASDDPVSTFLFRCVASRVLLELAATQEQVTATRSSFVSALVSMNPGRGVPCSIWLHHTRQYLELASRLEHSPASSDQLAIADALRIQVFLINRAR